MVSARLPRRTLLALLAQEDLILVVAVDHHVAFRAVEKVAYAGAVLVVGAPGAHFELDDLLLFGIQVRRGQRLRRLLIVIEQELATHGRDLARKLVDAESPHAHVGFMDALIPDVAIAVIPVPVPVVMDQPPREVPRLRGPLP